MADNDFYTFREYMKKENHALTASMEDYMEMIFRLSQDTMFTRINDLAAALNVQPPSATKMVQKLAEAGLVNYEKYGIIVLSEKGQQTGQALLRRHQVVEDFLGILGLESGVLEETEKIEHTISNRTLKYLDQLVSFFKSHLDVKDDWEKYKIKPK